MIESASPFITALKVITSFISETSIEIVLIVFLIICRSAISQFISRLTSFNYKSGASELGMLASNSIEAKGTIPLDEHISNEDDTAQIIDIQDDENHWFTEVENAFENDQFERAELAFKKYALQENNNEKLNTNKAFYLFIKNENSKDNDALKELEEHISLMVTDESKVNTSSWLSFYFNNTLQFQKSVDLWRLLSREVKSEEWKIKVLIHLANALDKNKNTMQAKTILLECFNSRNTDSQKSALYKALSAIELSLGNKPISVYCLDKSLEFDVNNREELFNSAHSASEEGIDEISISNYKHLINIDSKHSSALNNMGVRAQEVKLNIIAVSNYKESTVLQNTLSMANQGYLLLQSGFIDEAEKLAKSALESSDPHKNIYSLLTSIKEQKDEQNKKWNLLQEKSLIRQKYIREYIHQYYFGDSKEFEGDWYSSGLLLRVRVEEGKINADWTEVEADSLGSSSEIVYHVSLFGDVNGSSFNGKYVRKSNKQSLLLVSNTTQNCIGYLSSDSKGINIFSNKLENDFTLKFQRNPSVSSD
ncbi:hypothetical protein [Pseudoalteromonas sp. SMN1298-MNA-CIBAN-0114]|uniref:tetratricopeptide repeat protein n=1 Tax=Pseudoalteromonas sp. SMN1298-MNA-CIBAN-0114 TaxID=3140428 RepID=UPI0033235366